MFTGLIQRVGRIQEMIPTAEGRRLVIDAGGWPESPLSGESICVSGVCLTLLDPAARCDAIQFDVIEETLQRSALGELRKGDSVNLERSVTPTTLMGGHVVQGHVDGVGVVMEVQSDPADWRVRIKALADLMDCIAPKGSITVDGVSLTIATVANDSFEIALIPTTLEETTLDGLTVGARCNLETDILARTVVHWLRRNATSR